MGSQSTINTPMETLVTPSEVEGYKLLTTV